MVGLALRLGAGMAAVLALPIDLAHATWQETVLSTFDGKDGESPAPGGLIFDAAGNLYGESSNAVFELSPPFAGGTAWTRKALVSYSGLGPDFLGGVIFDSAGNLYGTSAVGGDSKNGTVFELSPPPPGKTRWTLKTLAHFDGTNGAQPYAGVILDAAGNLYGTTTAGGKSNNGTVFELSPPASGQTHWTLKTLVHFDGAGGALPVGGLLLDTTGNLYGTTADGGRFNDGTVFELSPPSPDHSAWSKKILNSFNGIDGAGPYGGVVFDAAGNLFGTTLAGGKHAKGTVFEASPPASGHTVWKFKSLVSFNGTDGGGPYGGSLLNVAGHLYGTTIGNDRHIDGNVFELSPPAAGHTVWTLKTLFTFDGKDGNQPSNPLTVDAAGSLYGTTLDGGDSAPCQCGTVFKLMP